MYIYIHIYIYIYIYIYINFVKKTVKVLVSFPFSITHIQHYTIVLLPRQIQVDKSKKTNTSRQTQVKKY